MPFWRKFKIKTIFQWIIRYSENIKNNMLYVGLLISFLQGYLCELPEGFYGKWKMRWTIKYLHWLFRTSIICGSDSFTLELLICTFSFVWSTTIWILNWETFFSMVLCLWQYILFMDIEHHKPWMVYQDSSSEGRANLLII